MFIQALRVHITAFHFLFIFWAAVWNPCWKWRPFVQKSGWEGSALELFEGLQTPLIIFKVVFLKAPLKELCIPPLFKSTASSKFWSQRLNAKLFIYITEPTPFFCIVLQRQRDQFIRFVFHCQAHQLGTRCAHSLSDHEHTDFTTELKPKQGEVCFHIRYLNFDRQGLSSDFLFGCFSTSYLLSQWWGLSTQYAVKQETALFFLWNNQSSRQTFLIFPLVAKGSTQKVS